MEINLFKQEVAEYFNQRTNYDLESDFHPRLAQRFLAYADIQPGETILDIATGTGLVAIEAAKIIGDQGQVIGVDISVGMLEQASSKITALGLNNIEMLLVDAEHLDFPPRSFDKVLCCSALSYFPNIPSLLGKWKNLLKPGGKIIISGFGEKAFIAALMLKKVAPKYSLDFPVWNELTGTESKCYTLLKQAGFQDVKIITEQFGNYLSWQKLQGFWESTAKNPLSSQLTTLTSDELASFKADYFQELEKLLTPQGIWNDITTYFISGGVGE